MDVPLLSLDALGRKYGTDKASGSHNYLSLYETFLQDLRHQSVRILEVGILAGASLRMWQEYFPNGTIIGADIHPGVKSFEGDRVVTEIVDQSNLEDLAQLCAKHGPFDIVVEDGSHLWEHQITTFKTLFPFVRNSGLYIVEDLHTNYGDMAPHYRGASSLSCMDYLQKIVALKVADDQIDIAAEEDPFLRTYGRNIESITFLTRACIVKKGYRPRRISPYLPGFKAPENASKPLLDASGEHPPIPLSIACHIGNVGDLHSHTGALTSTQPMEDIQGFIINSRGFPATAVEYRARLTDGRWTEWNGCGSFVGTMGLSNPLTGFSARLPENARSAYTLEVIGLFRDQPDLVQAGDEQDCVSFSGNGRLYGMQCVVRRK